MSAHSLSCSLVGLPNVGKSTLFNILTQSRSAQSANFPFCTIDPNVGIVLIPDTRLESLAKVGFSQKIVPAAMKIVDVAGLVQGAHEGAGLGNRFLSHVRETDLIIQVVRCFEDPDTIHVLGRIDPIGDVEIIHLECALADLKMAQESLQRRKGKAMHDPEISRTHELLRRCVVCLEEGVALRSVEWTTEERKALKEFPFLTMKPLILAANVGEEIRPQKKKQTPVNCSKRNVERASNSPSEVTKVAAPGMSCDLATCPFFLASRNFLGVAFSVFSPISTSS